MSPITGSIIGDIHVTVCKTPDGKKFFYLKTDNEDLLPVLDVIEDTLYSY